MNPRMLSAVLALVLGACQGPLPGDMESLYYEVREGQAKYKGFGATQANVMEREAQIFAKIRAAHATGELKTADDYFFGAAALVTSDDMDDLHLANEMALTAVELGEDRAFRLSAEAVDRILFKQGRPQRFGTQALYEPVLGEWRLHDLDPATSDEERVAMGVPPLAELRAWIDDLNRQGEMNRALQGDMPRDPVQLGEEEVY